jgi:glycerol kinase
MRAMEADAGVPIAQLRVDGGATVNDLLMQYQSDILGCKVVRPEVTETTALGAAYLAGLAVGYWTDLDAIAAQWSAEHTFSPTLDKAGRLEADARWNRAVRATLAWADDR